MKQLELFEKNNGDMYLYGELEKLRSSTDRRCRAIFSLLTELQNQVITIKEKNEVD